MKVIFFACNFITFNQFYLPRVRTSPPSGPASLPILALKIYLAPSSPMQNQILHHRRHLLATFPLTNSGRCFHRMGLVETRTSIPSRSVPQFPQFLGMRQVWQQLLTTVMKQRRIYRCCGSQVESVHPAGAEVTPPAPHTQMHPQHPQGLFSRGFLYFKSLHEILFKHRRRLRSARRRRG